VEEEIGQQNSLCKANILLNSKASGWGLSCQNRRFYFKISAPFASSLAAAG
jgi:hypothetical protein